MYLNLIPRSRLSSELSEPISKTGSAILTVVEFTVVVVPLTVKSPPIIASFVIANAPNVTESVACTPKSTFCITPFVVSLAVP